MRSDQTIEYMCQDLAKMQAKEAELKRQLRELRKKMEHTQNVLRYRDKYERVEMGYLSRQNEPKKEMPHWGTPPTPCPTNKTIYRYSNARNPP